MRIVEQNVPGEYTLGFAVVKRSDAFLMRDDRRPFLFRRSIADAKLYASSADAKDAIARCFPKMLGLSVQRIARCTVCDGGGNESCSRCGGSGREVRS